MRQRIELGPRAYVGFTQRDLLIGEIALREWIAECPFLRVDLHELVDQSVTLRLDLFNLSNKGDAFDIEMLVSLLAAHTSDEQRNQQWFTRSVPHREPNDAEHIDDDDEGHDAHRATVTQDLD